MGTPVTVMGLEIGHIPDPEIAKLTRKVMHISVVLALFALLNMIAALVGDPSKGAIAVVAFCIAISIPACGYIGARKNSAGLLGFFCGCACFQAVLTLISIILLIWTLVLYQRIEEECKTEETVCKDPETNEELTEKEVEKIVSRLTTIFIVNIIIAIGIFIVNFLAFTWGNALFQRLRAGQIIVASPAFPPTYTTNPQYGGGTQPVVMGQPVSHDQGQTYQPPQPSTFGTYAEPAAPSPYGGYGGGTTNGGGYGGAAAAAGYRPPPTYIEMQADPGKR
ncbi:unnamed protein product [Vitrella brassicaformis CCMP3155]|uniref:Uncharacterized protein n=2 Tax=Vitrella brassicaformis TaxID=1169539 RepID=A0A0G4ECB4_VITBC|nr:unnamed protein product [Vitrella brassicaformis CCMP3155]|eukprot:CEL93576.1 unnamed protein product [Vitrella brassicaformis CCMP3155]